MATLTFNGSTFIVDHATKGADYVHGYDANGNIVVSIDGVKDFSLIEYSGSYLKPADCTTEACNVIVYACGVASTRDGRSIPASAVGAPSMEQFGTKQNKLAWVTDEDVDAMFEGTYVGTEDEDPEGNGYASQISAKIENGVLYVIEEE